MDKFYEHPEFVKVALDYGHALAVDINGNWWDWTASHRTTYPSIANRWVKREFAPKIIDGWVYMDPGKWGELVTWLEMERSQS